MSVSNIKATVIAATIAISIPAYGQSFWNNLFTLSLGGGATLAQSDYQGNEIGLFGGGSLEYTLPMDWPVVIGFRFPIMVGSVASDDAALTPPEFSTSTTQFGSMLTLTVPLAYSHAFQFGGGASVLNFDPQDADGAPLPNNAAEKYGKMVAVYSGEFSYRFAINEGIGVALTGGYHMVDSDWLDDYHANDDNDAYVSAELSFQFLFPFGVVHDADGDGVEDEDDMCPGTPPGVTVDEKGCNIDDDFDGVPNDQDRCPDTPTEAEVDEFGCPVDTDQDGVPDYFDDCPNSELGSTVNEFGCPADTDQDGVPDDDDRCPGTPPGAPVNLLGCPLDSDNDGVPDVNDKCPDTPVNATVDEDGCETKESLAPKSEDYTKIPPGGESYNFDAERRAAKDVFTDGRLYCLQLHAFYEEWRAQEIVGRLRGRGHPAFIQEAQKGTYGRIVYRVRVGFFGSLPVAKNYRTLIR
jgi:hypothetical protein